jgi:multidrug efflux pump subunit AcrA (membrane-fusion protein)
VKNLKLEAIEAEEVTFEETVFALGRIGVAPGHRAVVSSRVPGRVLSVAAHIDRPIEKGAEAVVLESRQPGDPPPTVRLIAPISGMVSAVHVVPGLPIEQKDSLVEISDLSEVHAVAAVPEHLIGKLKPGQKAHIRVAAYPDRTFEAELAHIGAEADTQTNALEAAFHVDNPETLLRPGMRAEFSIVSGAREGVMAVPREAVQGDAAARFVYVKDYELPNAFVKTPVVLGAQNDRFAEIISGLLPGDEVVTRGAYSLAFAGKGSVSLKEAMDAAHGHPHKEDGSEMTKEDLAAAAAGSAGHGHESGKKFTPLTTFFAGTTGLLFVLLILSLVARKRTTA